MAHFLPAPVSAAAAIAEPLTAFRPSWGNSWQPEDDGGISVAGLISMLRRHWLMIGAITGLSLIVAYGVIRLTRPLYQASSTLYFAKSGSSIPALAALSQMENGTQQIASEMEVMRSRALAVSVVEKLGMQLAVVDPKGASTSSYMRIVRVDSAAPRASFGFSKVGDSFLVRNLDSGVEVGRAVAGEPFTFGNATVVLLPSTLSQSRFQVDVNSRERAVANLLEHLGVTLPNPSAAVVRLAYTSPDPMRAKDVPDVLARTYLAWRATLRKSGDRSTVEFLKRQIDTISVQVYAAEEAIRRFRETNRVVDLATQATTQVQRLAALEAQRGDLEVQRASLRNLMAEVKNAPADNRVGSPYRRLLSFPGIMPTGNPALSLLQTLSTLEQRRNDLLVRRTPKDPDVEAVSQEIHDVESQIGAVVETYLQGLDAQAASLTTQIAAFRGETNAVPRKEVDYARLLRTATGLTEVYTMLGTRLHEAEIAEAVDDGTVRVVDRAAFPIQPIWPRPLRIVLLGAVLGLFLGVSGAMLRDRLDYYIHTKDDVEAISPAPVLALIPHIGKENRALSWRKWLREPGKSLVASNGSQVAVSDGVSRLLMSDLQSVASEAFRKLRTNISFARPESPPRVLVFTSAAPGDGKSTSVMNLAIVLSQQGKRVVVIDADLRRGGLHRLVAARVTPGLSEILVGQQELEAAVQALPGDFGAVDLIATGVIPPNPAELLASPRFRQVLEILRSAYDAVLIDSPPINLVTDAAIIGREADGAIFVVRAARSTRGEVAHALAQLQQVQVTVTGVILNDYNAKRDGKYGQPYYHNYRYGYKPNAGTA